MQLQRQSQCFQQGQSTIEFVVVTLFVLLPLMLVVPLLGKYADITQATEMASRYVAFEGSVHNTSSAGGWKTDAVLADEVRSIFFSNSDLPINSVVPATNVNPLWFDHRGNALLPDLNTNITVATATSNLSLDPLGLFATNTLDLSGNLNAAGKVNFNLPHNNLYSGRVNVSIANVLGMFPALNGANPFNNLNLVVSHNTSILVDSWAATSSDQVTSRIQSSTALFPYHYSLQPVPANYYALLDNALQEFEPQVPPPSIGRVDPDIAPY